MNDLYQQPLVSIVDLPILSSVAIISWVDHWHTHTLIHTCGQFSHQFT